MRKHALKLGTVLILALAFAVAPQRAAADDDDPPSRVARLSHMDGSVSFEPAGTEDWVTAVINRPVTTGDKLWADQNSRAELQLGSATIRMGATTGFSFLNLGDNTTQLQLTEGTVRINVRRLQRDEIYEVDTPNLAFSILRPGIYTINVNQGGDTTVVNVRQGEGEVTGGGQSYSVHANETGTFAGIDQLTADVEGIGNPDDLETWSQERDSRWERAPARRYVSEDAVGYEDLDEYGSWRDTPDYGTIWFPRAAEAGWAPYRYGHWAYIYPWGYTWVDDEPWGFAPFHYGRWVAVGGSWGWIPCRPAAVGVAYVRPVYAPALVAWVGGPSVAVGIAIGGGPAVGWFPLGPREVYMPSYRVSRTYVNQVNVTNTTVNTTVVNNYYNNVVVNKNTNVTNVRYVNQGVAGAVTATSQETLSTGRPVHSNIVRVNEQQIARAPVASATPAIAPQRQAFVGSARPAAVKPPPAVVTRAVVAKTAPPPAPPRVDRQITAVQQNGGRPIAISQARAIEKQEQPRAAVRMAPPAKPAQPQNVGRGQQPQNQNRPGQQPSNVQPNAPANAPSNAQPTRPPEGQPNRPNEQPNRPPNAQPQPNERPNAQPNRPNEQPNRPPNAQPQPNERPNAQPNRPPANERPNNERPNNERNDRPPSAQPNRPPNAQPNERPSAQPNRPQPNEQPNRAPNTQPQPNERPNTPPSAQPQPNRPPANERPNNQRNGNDRPPSAQPNNPPPARPPEERPQPLPQPRQQERPQPQPRPEERPQPQPQPRQQERPQPQPRPEERPQPQPRQQERPQPQPRPQERPQERPQPRPQQQEKPKQPEKPPKEKEKDKPPKK